MSVKNLTEEERQRVLIDWNDTRKDYPADKCIHELFEAQVVLTPNATALISEGHSLTYDELNQNANRLAHALQSLGVNVESRVGILAHRSIGTIVSMLAILKAGGVYVPLDPDYPEERLQFLLRDIDASVLLAETKLSDSLPKNDTKIIFFDSSGINSKGEQTHNPENKTTAENLCYILYTSGSTGRPKGVCIPHRGVVRLVKEPNYVRLTADETLLQLCPLSFDVSTFEIWGALLNGARLVIPPAEKLSTHEIGDVLRKYHVTTLWLTSWLFHEMVDSNLESLKGVRQLLAGGDVVSVPHAKRVLKELPDCQLINGYGPTENTTFSCCYPVPNLDAIGKSVPIGGPICNSTAYILNEHLEPVAIGEIGEIYMGGDGLARGYLNNPELSEERFIPNPFVQDGSRIYKSGDLGRWLPEGIIEFLGRLDDQVKIRGFRIEPGEIETLLIENPDVRQAVVVLNRNHAGIQRLLAYIVLREKRVDLSEQLKEFLNRKLPDFMIPTQFVFLDSFPMTPNGKIDRRSLPTPPDRDSFGSQFIAPRNSVEEMIQTIWLEVLDEKQIGVEDDFFSIGGDSLSATRVISRIYKIFKIELPLRIFFEKSTIAGLAQELQLTSGQI